MTSTQHPVELGGSWTSSTSPRPRPRLRPFRWRRQTAWPTDPRDRRARGAVTTTRRALEAVDGLAGIDPAVGPRGRLTIDLTVDGRRDPRGLEPQVRRLLDAGHWRRAGLAPRHVDLVWHRPGLAG